MVSAPNSAQDEVRHGNPAPTVSGAGRGVEKRTIDMVPDSERHGTPKSQFTLWFGVNMQITAVVNGALAVVFGADVVWALVGLFIGQIIGGAVMALHSAQGPALGLPQMISSRAQFGVYGAVLPLFLVLLLYYWNCLGWTSYQQCIWCPVQVDRNTGFCSSDGNYCRVWV